MKDVSEKVTAAKQAASRATSAVKQARDIIIKAVKSTVSVDDLASKLERATAKAEQGYQAIARFLMEQGVTLEDFKQYGECREQFRLYAIEGYYGKDSKAMKYYYADADTLTEQQAALAEQVRVKSNNMGTQLTLQWQYCLDRDAMFAEYRESLAAWNEQNKADDEFATAMDDDGMLLNPIPTWAEPTRAAATRWRNEKDERQRDTAYHAKKAIEVCDALAAYASDPELIPLTTQEAGEIQKAVESIKAVFGRYTAKAEQ